MKPIVLSIGTTHPWNVAGVGRDIVVGTERNARVFTAVAAVSAQDRSGVAALQAVSGPVFLAQLDALPWGSAGAVRVGALPNAQSVRAVASALRERVAAPAVVDPVFAASGGGELADETGREALRDELATLPNVVLTPNLVEAALLLGLPEIARDEPRRRRRRASLARGAGGAAQRRPPHRRAGRRARDERGARDFCRAAHRRLDARDRLHPGDGAGLRIGRRNGPAPRGPSGTRVRSRAARKALRPPW